MSLRSRAAGPARICLYGGVQGPSTGYRRRCAGPRSIACVPGSPFLRFPNFSRQRYARVVLLCTIFNRFLNTPRGSPNQLALLYPRTAARRMACPSFSPPRSSIGWLPAGSIIRLVGVRPALWAVVGCGVRHLRRASACGHGLNLFLIASSQRLAGLALSPAASPVRQHRRRSSCGSPFASPSSSTPSSRAGVNNVPPPRAVQAVPGHRHPEASSHTAYVAVALEGFDGCASALLPLAKDEQVLVAKKGKRGWVFGWQLVADQDGSVVPGRSGWVPEAFLTPLRKFDCPHCVPGNARYLSTTESKAEAELAIAVRDMNAKLEAIYASVRIEQHARSKHDIELGVFQDSAPLSPALATDSTWQATMEQQNSERTSAAHDRPGEREAVTKARQYGRAPATKCLTLDASHFGHFQPHKQHGVAESRDMMPASISSTGRKPDPGLFFESGLPHPPSPPRDDPGDLLVSSPQALKADASSLTSAHQGSDDVPPIPGVRTWSLEAKTKVKGGAMAVSTSSELLNMQKMRAEVIPNDSPMIFLINSYHSL